MEYFSQYKQDKFLDENIFNKKRNGVFVEIGAHNGTAFSNTCFFERERGWTGLCVEPIPHCFEQLKNNRKCICLNACISNIEGEEDFLVVNGYSEMLSGLLNSYDPNHIKRVNSEIIQYGGNKKIQKVQTLLLGKTLSYFNLDKVDYCSIDTEGSEMKILESINFDKNYIYCFSIENNYKDNSIEIYLKNKGYKLSYKLGCDDIYIKL